MKKNSRWILVAAVSLILASLACISPGGSPTPVPEPTEVPPTVAPTEPPVEAPKATPVQDAETGSASLEIINQSGVDLWYVYISSTKSEEWGEDWLGDAMILEGETYVVEGIPEGVYDIRVENENGELVESAWEVALEGMTSWNITGQVSLEVLNTSDERIAYLYISPVDSDSWGQDWLGDEVIEAEGSYVVEGIPRGSYDMQVTNADDEAIETVFNVDMSGSKSWTVEGKTNLPSNAVLRFEEDFSDNRNDWGFDTEGEDVFYMRPSGGEYCILIKSNNWTAWEWYEPFRPDEFVVEVSCALEQGNDASCGLGFGPDGDNLYWFEVSPYDQTYALFLLEEGAWQDNLVDWTESKVIDPSGMNFLSMERVGGTLSMYINGILVDEVDGSRFPTGRIGIGGSTYEDGNVTVCLDNLRVWRME